MVTYVSVLKVKQSPETSWCWLHELQRTGNPLRQRRVIKRGYQRHEQYSMCGEAMALYNPDMWDPHETLRSNDHTHYSDWPDFRMHWRMTKNRRNTLYPDMRKVFDTVSHLEILIEAKPVSGISRVICQSCQEEVPIRSALINGTNPTQFPSGIHSVPCQMGIEWDGCHLWGHV